jgi:nucleoside-diphosphate-sugar epimerase
MKCLVTGVAGFIGSHMTQRLLEEGFSVIGIDSFNNFYPRWIKEKNILPYKEHEKFRLIAADINDVDLDAIFKEIQCVFHFAAQAGVRSSWGENFSAYTENNITATQKLLETAKDYKLIKFVNASSSSVYGLCPEFPMTETSPLHPYSPYGVTKLAAENLCQLYFKNYEIPTVSLRFFTVYGPNQRPDMAFHKFMKAIVENAPISVFGDGQQTRDFTYVDDIVEANYRSLEKATTGNVYNLGGGNRRELKTIFPVLEKITGKKVNLRWEERQKGDVFHTLADIQKAKTDLGYSPQTPIEEGLKREWEWIQRLYSG